MSELIVRRQKALWQDLARRYRVHVDGIEVAQITNGKQVQFAIEPGDRVVQLKIDWCRSSPLKISVRPGEVVLLDCGPNATPLLALLYITILRGKYLWLRQGKEAANPASQPAHIGQQGMEA